MDCILGLTQKAASIPLIHTAEQVAVNLPATMEELKPALEQTKGPLDTVIAKLAESEQNLLADPAELVVAASNVSLPVSTLVAASKSIAPKITDLTQKQVNSNLDNLTQPRHCKDSWIQQRKLLKL